MLNGVVGYQLLDDGTPLSLGLILISAIALFIGTGYIALDTGFDWTNRFQPSVDPPLNRNVGIYVLYQLAPLVFLFVFFVLETVLVIKVLGEKKPMCSSSLHSLGPTEADKLQYISSPRRCCLRLARYSNTLSAHIYAVELTARLMALYSKHSSPFSQSSCYGYSGRVLQRMTGRCPYQQGILIHRSRYFSLLCSFIV